MTTEAKDKIALFCNVKTGNVIQNLDVDSLYELPLVLEKEGLARIVQNELGMEDRAVNLDEWRELTRRQREATRSIKVALVGKYVAVPDAYLSVVEALNHAGIAQNVRVIVDTVNSEEITPDTVDDLLRNHAAVIVPGGFGDRGTDGMIYAAKYARENKIPFLAIGFGMQLAVVEAARNLLDIADAHTTEADPQTTHPVVHIPEDRICQNDSRGATRMGGSDIRLKDGLVRGIYASDTVRERHSNRYEIDPQYLPALEAKGFRLVGTDVDSGYPEVFEMDGHPFYVAVIYHPEYISRPNRPHPLFSALLETAKAR